MTGDPQPAQRDAFRAPEIVREMPSDDGAQGNTKVGKRELVEALEKTGWVQAKAARMLNLTPRQIGYAIRKYGIEVRRIGLHGRPARA